MKLRLFTYWRSSASQRVRIGLGLKGLGYEYVAVNLLQQEQLSDAYRARNPIAQLPTLEITEDDGRVYSLTQSLAILEFLDERFPASPLLPEDPVLRARTRALAEIINSGIQPLQNLSVIHRLGELGVDAKESFVPAYIAAGLAAYAKATADVAGKFSVGDAPTIADCCLIPQLGAARRFDVSLDDHPRLLAIEASCLALPAFANAAPERQPDAPSQK